MFEYLISDYYVALPQTNMENLSAGLNGDSGGVLIYEEVDAEIEIVEEAFDHNDNSEAVDVELEAVVFSQPETNDPNDNPKYCQGIRNKQELLKCGKSAHFQATRVRF